MTVTVGGRLATVPAKQRVVLAALLLRANRVVSAESIAEELWDGDPPTSARNTIQGYVNRLRQILPAGRLQTRAPGYLIEVRAGELDLDRFTGLCDQAQLAAGRGDWPGAAGQLIEALTLWRGEPLADVPAAVLQRTEVPRLCELRTLATESRIDAGLHLGRHGELVAELRQLAANEPLREALHAQLMRALYGTGRQAEALEVFRRIDHRLRDELGICPGAGLQQLHQQILGADPALAKGLIRTGEIRPASAGDTPPARPARPALPSGTAPRELPAVTARFVGRAAELDTLTALLGSTTATAPIAAISGPPGVGKTTLALTWAHHAADRFPDGQLYVNLRGFDASGEPVPAAVAIRGFLDGLGVAAERIPAGLPAQAALYRSLLSGRRVLVMLDNARDAAQVRPLLPGAAGCLALVTSRSRLPGLIAAEGARPIGLKPLSGGEAVELLARGVGADRVASDREAVHELIVWCARLPLAISVAAARAAIRPGVPLAALAAELRDASTRLDFLDTREAASSLRTVYSWSCEQLSPPAARMFRLLGLHPGPEVSLAAAASLAGLALREARAALEELMLSSLLSEDHPGRYWFHDLLRVYAAEQALAHESSVDRRRALRRLLDHYLITAYRAAMLQDPHREKLELPVAESGVIVARLADHDEALIWCEREYPVLMNAITAADSHGLDVHAWQLCSCLTGFFAVRARPHEWRSAALIALSAAGRAGDGYGQAQARHALARAYTTMGRYDDASPHYSAALGLYQALGDDLGLAHVHLDFGLSYEFRRRHHDVFGAIPAQPRQERDAHEQGALTHAYQALELYRAVGHHSGEAAACGAVGRSLALRGLHEEAVGYCERAVRMNHDLSDDGAEAVALVSLGYALHKAGRYPAATAACQRSLDLAQRVRSPRMQAIALTHLAESHRSTGNIPAARAAWAQALVILDDLQLPDADQVRTRLASAEQAGAAEMPRPENFQPGHFVASRGPIASGRC